MRAILLSLLLFVSVSAKSQILISLLFGDKLNSPNVEFGLEGGVNWSNISGLESNGYSDRLNLGFYFNFRVKNQWFVNTGLLVKSSLGSGNLTVKDLALTDNGIHVVDGEVLDGRYDQILDYFIVPVLAKYRFKNNFYIAAGPQFGLMYNAFVEFNTKRGERPQARIREPNTSHFRAIDMGATGGIGYVLRGGEGMTIGLKYYQGFLDVYKDAPGTKNSSVFAHVNIPIGAGSKKEKAED